MPVISLLSLVPQLLRCEKQDRRPGLLFLFMFSLFDGQDGWLSLACVFIPQISPFLGSGTFRFTGGVKKGSKEAATFSGCPVCPGANFTF